MKKKDIGGIIRPNSSGTWHILNDSGHQSDGLNSISQTSTYIQVNFDSFAKIYTAAITPDETLVQNDIQCGASVGLNNVKIFFAEDDVTIQPTAITNTSANVWIYIIGYIDTT